MRRTQKTVPLSPFLHEQRGKLKAVVRRLSDSFDYVSILGTDVSSSRCEVRRDETTIRDGRWAERGFVLRLHDGTGYNEYSVNRIDDPEEFCRRVKDWVDGSLEGLRVDDAGAYPVPAEEPLSKAWRSRVKMLPEALPSGERIDRFRTMVDRAVALSQAVAEARVVYEETRVAKLFLSGARNLAQSYLWSTGSFLVLVRRDGESRYTFDSYSGLKGPELIDEMEAGVERTVREAEALLDAERVEPGEYDVICSPKVTGVLAHEAFGHGVEMDMFVRKRAKAAEYLGKPVASPLVTLRDGARSAREVSSYFFDDEGTPASDTLIIDRGVFVGGLTDVLSADRLGVAPTGNGRRESFERKAYARMTNTFIAAGEDSLEAIIGSVDRGYLLEKVSSGMEDPRNWGLQIIVLFGREIRAGRLTGKIVAPVILTGYVPDVLGSVSMVGDRVELSGSGMCGKGHKEYAKVSDGGPYIKARMRLV